LFNYPDQSVKGTSGKRKTETWAVKNLPAIPSEYGAPPIHEVAPYVALGASTFKLGNFKGDMSTWIEYGKFMAQLIEGQDQLPDFEKQKVAEIVAICNPKPIMWESSLESEGGSPSRHPMSPPRVMAIVRRFPIIWWPCSRRPVLSPIMH
jgi:hypothetical protein